MQVAAPQTHDLRLDARERSLRSRGRLAARTIAFVALAVILSGLLREPALAIVSHATQWSGYRQDFTALYSAAQMIGSGSGNRIYDLKTVSNIEAGYAGHPVGGTGALGYFNPPFFALLLTPLTRFSLEHAYQVWTVCNLLCLAVDLWLLWRIATGVPRLLRLGLAVAFLTLVPVTYGLLLGQFSLILVTSWMATFLFLRAGHERWAGAAASALLIKPELLVPVVLFLALKRRWRVLTTLMPITLLAVVVSISVIGFSSALAYPAYLLHSTQWQANGIAANVMFGWSGIAAMVWSQPTAAPVAMLAVALLSLATLAAVWHVWRGDINPRSPRFAQQWCALTAATVLIDPHMYLQDTAILAPAAIALFAGTAGRERRTVGAVLLVGWALLALGSFPNEHLGLNLFGLYLVAGVAALVLSARRWNPLAAAADRVPEM